MTKRRRLTIIFIVAEILDLLLTAVAVWGLGHSEANPLINYVPLWGLMIFKVFSVSLVAYYLYHSKVMYLWVYKVVCVCTIAVVIWNSLNIVVGLVI